MIVSLEIPTRIRVNDPIPQSGSEYSGDFVGDLLFNMLLRQSIDNPIRPYQTGTLTKSRKH